MRALLTLPSLLYPQSWTSSLQLLTTNSRLRLLRHIRQTEPDLLLLLLPRRPPRRKNPQRCMIKTHAPSSAAATRSGSTVTTVSAAAASAAAAGAERKRKRQVMAKFYGVQVGRRPGVYGTWAECLAEVKGFKNAKCRWNITTSQWGKRMSWIERNRELTTAGGEI